MLFCYMHAVTINGNLSVRKVLACQLKLLIAEVF